jgi:hypothetical protein
MASPKCIRDAVPGGGWTHAKMSPQPHAERGVVTQTVFISYSRADRTYVEDLAAHLSRAGVAYWYDYRIVTGDRFDKVIAEQIDGCGAFVVVMTPASFDSDWVANEINYAKAKGKPILPLLLGGSVFISLNSRDYEDVSRRQMPGPKFMAHLASLVGVHPPAAPPVPAQPVTPTAVRAKAADPVRPVPAKAVAPPPPVPANTVAPPPPVPANTIAPPPPLPANTIAPPPAVTHWRRFVTWIVLLLIALVPGTYATLFLSSWPSEVFYGLNIIAVGTALAVNPRNDLSTAIASLLAVAAQSFGVIVFVILVWRDITGSGAAGWLPTLAALLGIPAASLCYLMLIYARRLPGRT